MAASLYLKQEDFPEVFAAVNRLADLIRSQTGARPSIRRLSAGILVAESQRRIAELETQNQPTG